jgi:hypothetical protein
MMPVRLRPPHSASAAAQAQQQRQQQQQGKAQGGAAGQQQQQNQQQGSRKRSRPRSAPSRPAPPVAAKIVGTSSRGRPLLLKVLDSAVSLLPFGNKYH